MFEGRVNPSHERRLDRNLILSHITPPPPGARARSLTEPAPDDQISIPLVESLPYVRFFFQLSLLPGAVVILYYLYLVMVPSEHQKEAFDIDFLPNRNV